MGAPSGRFIRIAALLAAMLAAQSAAAQRVRGVLRDSASGEPLPGAVVWLGDSADHFLARGVSQIGGRFDLPRILGAARLHVLRIGYRPRTLTLAPPPADSDVNVALAPIPLRLAAVQARGRRVCPGDKDAVSGLELWNQARAALYASLVARELDPPTIQLYSYVQTLDPIRRRILEDSSEMKHIVADKSYVAARSAARFASEGYMREEPGGERTFYAPDAEVLFDTTFVETHCLHAVTGTGSRKDYVGVGFEPITEDGRDTLVDVRGTLWIHPDPARLDELEFSYTGLEPAAKGSGGHVRFKLSPSGAPFVSGWEILTATVADDENPSPAGIRRRALARSDRSDYRLVEYVRTGGAVIDMNWSGRAGVPAFPRIVGSVVDSAGKPVMSARVWVRGGEDTVWTAADGTFALPPQKPGARVVLASDSSLVPLGIARTVPVAVLTHGIGDFPVHLVYHSRAEVLQLVCPTGSYHPGTGVVLVRALNTGGAGLAGAKVTVLLDSMDVDAVGDRRTRQGVTDPRGNFSICGLPLGRPVRVEVENTGKIGTAKVEHWNDDVKSLIVVVP